MSVKYNYIYFNNCLLSDIKWIHDIFSNPIHILDSKKIGGTTDVRVYVYVFKLDIQKAVTKFLCIVL